MPGVVDPDALAFVGTGLSRPECVLATAAGLLYSSDWRGGVAVTDAATGRSRLIAARRDEGRAAPRPNGIALRADGTLLLAELGESTGGVFVLHPDDARIEPFLTHVDGVQLPPTNFVVEDRAGRVWTTVSTRRVPRAAAYRSDVADGFVVVCEADGSGARIAADGLGYTNECAIDPSGRWLYVVETFARRLSRFALRDGGAALGARETVTEFGEGAFPDGMAFDADGHAWIAAIVGNRVLRVAPDGTVHVVLEDADPEHVARVEDAYRRHAVGRPHLDTAAGRRLRNVSSIAFGGADLRTVYLGCLLGDTIASFRSPVAGHPPIHWER